MLTTLLLKYYPDRSLTFIPEATCWTIVPHTFRILLSQVSIELNSWQLAPTLDLHPNLHLRPH